MLFTKVAEFTIDILAKLLLQVIVSSGAYRIHLGLTGFLSDVLEQFLVP